MKARGKIRKYIEDYKFNSLFFKNLLLLLLLILIPLTGTTILVYYAYDNMQKNDIRSYNEKITADAYSDMERILKEARTELTYIGFNSNVEAAELPAVQHRRADPSACHLQGLYQKYLYLLLQEQ